MEDGGWGGRRPEPRQEDGPGEPEDGQGAAPAYEEESRWWWGCGYAREGGGGTHGAAEWAVSLREVPGAVATMGEGAVAR